MKLELQTEVSGRVIKIMSAAANINELAERIDRTARNETWDLAARLMAVVGTSQQVEMPQGEQGHVAEFLSGWMASAGRYREGEILALCQIEAQSKLLASALREIPGGVLDSDCESHLEILEAALRERQDHA